MTAGGAVVLVNQTARTITTYDNEGRPRSTAKVDADKGPLRATPGQDGRIYVDNTSGTRTTVVDGDGTITPVRVGDGAPHGPAPTSTVTTPGPGSQTSSSTPSTPPSSSTPPAGTPGGPGSTSSGSGGTSSTSSADPPSQPPDRSSPPSRPTTRSGSTTGRAEGGNRPRQPAKPETPKAKTPKADVPDAPPTVGATAASTKVTVRWTRPASNGAPLTSYQVTVRSGGTTVKTKKVAAGTLRTTVSGLAAGKRFVVTVAARNRVGRGPARSSGPFATKAPTPTCGQAMLNNGPSLLYRVDDGGGTAADSSGTGRAGSYIGGVSHGQAGPCGAGGAAGMNGSSGYAPTQAVVPNPTTFTTAVWFKTTTTYGGSLIGYGTNLPGNDSHYDRHIYMLNSGQLEFGVFNNRVYLTAKTQRSYNDGKWHLAAASLGANGMNLYVDGQGVGHNDNTAQGPAYDGHWDVGWTNLDLWPDQPTSSYFGGTLALAAVYDHVLTPAQIAAMYRARG